MKSSAKNIKLASVDDPKKRQYKCKAIPATDWNEQTKAEEWRAAWAQAGKSQYSQSLYNLKDAAKMLNFLQTNNIMDMAGLDEKFKSMIGEQLDIQGKLKPVERRLGSLKKHIGQADIYFKHKGKAADRSRANPKERLQYFAAGTAGAAAPQNAGYGAITNRAAG